MILFIIMYEDYVISPLYSIILLQGSYLSEGRGYCKHVTIFLNCTDFQEMMLMCFYMF